jgi:hypothetical protein
MMVSTFLPSLRILEFYFTKKLYFAKTIKKNKKRGVLDFEVVQNNHQVLRV